MTSINHPPAGPPPLTDEQARPLAVEGASVALAAGAGCGKTLVLTARYFGDIDGPSRRPLRSIVALTFTQKAARELRQRIRARCRDRLSRADPEDVGRWRGVLRGLEAAPIGTFHEFCGEWLRRHAADAGIDPDFAVLDESIAGTIRDEALGRCLREWLADGDDDLIALAVEFGLPQVRHALADLSANRAVGDLDAWSVLSVEEIVARWEAAWDERGLPARLHKVGRAARRCLECLSANDCSQAKMRERRAFLLEYLPEIGRREFLNERMAEIREQAKIQGTKKEHWSSVEVYEQIKMLLEGLRKEIDAFQKSGVWDEEATRASAEHGRRLARLALRLRRAYAEAKRSRGGLDFDDLLILTRDLLRKQPELTGEGEGGGGGGDENAGGAIARLLVDEFQDTDEVQGEILRRLGGDRFAAGRLFLVGDAKQSIYRFRGAQPRIFQEFRDEFDESGHHALTANFRSVPAVLDFVNALFADAFAEPYDRLVPGLAVSGADDAPAVEFLWADESDEDDNPRPSTTDRRKAEARWIARRLRRRIDDGWIVRDRRSQERRRADPGDIAFLFRAMTDVGFYESALAEEGFDYHVVGGSAFYAQQEVHDLINLLSVVEDPLDVVSLAGALRSPFFGVSDDGLYWLATSPSGDLADGLRDAGRIDELSPLDRERAGRARAFLERWRAAKDRVPIAALVDRVLDESGYEAALLGEYLGARKRANSRKLVRLARRFDEQGGFTVADFVARLRADLRRAPREEQASTTDEEGTSVRLMSIHQAKGLEFPIVVLPDLNRKAGGDAGTVAFHPELGLLVKGGRDAAPGDGATDLDEPAGPEGSGGSLGWMTYRAIERVAEDEEALRLFYVATTRARDALILSAGMSPTDKPLSPALTLLAERFDRANGSCRVGLNEGWGVPAVHITTVCPPPSDTNPTARAPRPDLLAVAETIDVPPLVDVPSPDVPRRIRPRFVDLESGPTRGLSPPLARLDRLVRAILADPRALRPKELSRLASALARRQVPAAPASLVARALERLRPWPEGEPGRLLSEATQVERRLSWTVTWPAGSPGGTVFQGTVDLLFRDRHGDWNAVVAGVAEASGPCERFRLLLAAHAADSLGFGPIRRGWWLRLGPEFGLHGEGRFDAAAIDAALSGWIDSPTRDGISDGS